MSEAATAWSIVEPEAAATDLLPAQLYYLVSLLELCSSIWRIVGARRDT